MAFVVWPALHTFWFSLFEWNGVSRATWTGFSNYAEILTEPELRGAIWHALILVMFFSWLPIVIGLVMVGLLARHRRRGMTTYRTLFFLPQVLPMVAVGITWRWMYGEDGTVNQVLGWVGLDSITRAWLGDFDLALPAVGLIGSWALTGLCMMLFLTGAQKVDTSLYEAARLDGAGPIREFVSITLPELRGEIVIAMTVTTVAALASFDIVFVTTNGGPGDQTTVPGLLLYRLAFSDRRVGLAAAMGILLALLILIAVYLIRRLAGDVDEP
ncbi:MAG: ABC transporter permease subunit [Acidimicrobiia bacterium]|nr:ABC transporter permease subunit [Acidimicrobiia bacterium]